MFSKEYPELNKEGFAKVYAERYANFEPLCQYLNLVSDIANLSDGLAVTGEVTLVRYTVLKEIDQNIRTGFEEGKMRFKQLLKLKREITTRISSIELLAKDVLWINLLFSDNMFGYKSIKTNIQERLEYIDGQIRDKYNTKIQSRLHRWTLAIVILTVTMLCMMITDIFSLQHLWAELWVKIQDGSITTIIRYLSSRACALFRGEQYSL